MKVAVVGLLALCACSRPATVSYQYKGNHVLFEQESIDRFVGDVVGPRGGFRFTYLPEEKTFPQGRIYQDGETRCSWGYVSTPIENRCDAESRQEAEAFLRDVLEHRPRS